MNKILSKISKGNRSKLHNLRHSEKRYNAKIRECYRTAVDTYSKRCFKVSNVNSIIIVKRKRNFVIIVQHSCKYYNNFTE